MDFANLLNFANQNVDAAKNKVKLSCDLDLVFFLQNFVFFQDNYYKTKLAPAKKDSKDKKLSANIRKFLHKQEAEQREAAARKEQEARALLASRDTKQKNKINKMLKVIKSANKSVLDDAKDDKNTAVTLQGPDQPDEDDYGYVSQEASAFYSKIMQKYSTDPKTPEFLKKKSGRVLDRKSMQEKLERARKDLDPRNVVEKSRAERRPRTSKDPFLKPAEVISNEPITPSVSKPVVKKAPAKPPLSFNDILKLAEKKQHEDIVIPVKQNKEPERLMTSKERAEEQARLAALKRKADRMKAGGESSGSKEETPPQDSKLFAALTTNKPKKPDQPLSKNVVKPPNKPPIKVEPPLAASSSQQQRSVMTKTEPKVGAERVESLPKKPIRPEHIKPTMTNPKRRIESESEDEYDSDDSFIDNSGDANVSSYIKEIFGYDRSK